ncbi:TPA: polysaccharide deacetylase family protein [Streptococcus suis]|nr:polysaccharide deacetylase family protein [Streptococcus suis]
MKKFLLFLSSLLAVGLVAVSSFYIYQALQDREITKFVTQKSAALEKLNKASIEAGNIGSTHVVAAIPTDQTGQRIVELEQKMVDFVHKKLGNKKPTGTIKGVFLVSSKEKKTNFKNITAHEISSEHYKLSHLSLKKNEQDIAEPVLLTEDYQVFTLGKMLTDLEGFKELLNQKIVSANSLSEEEAVLVTEKVANLDLNALRFDYKDSQLTLHLPEGEFASSEVQFSIDELFSVVNGDYLTDLDKASFDQYHTQQVDKTALRQVALTFDDGPSRLTTPIVLDLLKKYKAKATFFVLGQNIAGNEDILKRMKDEGHEIANHTWSHPNLTRITADQVKQEIELTQSAIEEVIGHRPSFMRPPYGAVNGSVAAAAGLASIYWNVDTQDWSNRDPHLILSQVKAYTNPGAIILMHDIHQTTVDGLEPVLQYLTEQQYSLVTTTELLGENLNPGFIYYDQVYSGPAQ